MCDTHAMYRRVNVNETLRQELCPFCDNIISIVSYYLLSLRNSTVPLSYIIVIVISLQIYILCLADTILG